MLRYIALNLERMLCNDGPTAKHGICTHDTFHKSTAHLSNKFEMGAEWVN